jgi:hypothetical protein
MERICININWKAITAADNNPMENRRRLSGFKTGLAQIVLGLSFEFRTGGWG